MNAHSVTTLRCKSYSGCFALSFLKVQCPFYLWLIRTTVLQRYLALILIRIFIITATPACLISGKSCSVVLSNTPCRQSHNEAGHLILGSKLMLTAKSKNSWVYILIPQPMTACVQYGYIATGMKNNLEVLGHWTTS